MGDPHSAAARELIQSLGGKRKLRYTMFHRVISRGDSSTHYDAVLVMGQPGEQSLQTLYARMIPDEEKSKQPDASCSPASSDWLTSVRRR